MSSFCTSRRIAKCSHRFTMLRFRYLASHKNNLIIDDFLGWGAAADLLPNIAQNFLHHKQFWVEVLNNLVIYDF